MRFVVLIAVVGISISLAPLSYAQHGGGHMGGGFSGHGILSSGHSSGHSSHSSSRFVSGIHHIVPGFWRSNKSVASSRDSVAEVRVGTGAPPHRPIIGIRPSAPLFLRRPPIRNPCFGHAFCSGFGFGFGSPLVCDPLFGFGRCLPFFGLTLGFQDDSFSTGALPQDVVPGASDLSATPTASSTFDAEPNPVTLLQLKNGWMYGLIDYWVEGDNLHYVTNYGGKNSVPLDQIDLAATTRLNSERGIAFSLHTKGPSTAP
jgi:hypothetical protein